MADFPLHPAWYSEAMSEEIAAKRDALPVEPYLAYWRHRQAMQQAQNARLAEQAHKDARQIAEMLRSRFGVTQVVLFGSLAKGRFETTSDLDLAVAGLAAADFFQAAAQASKLSDFPVDLKPLEALAPHFLAAVLTTGIEI